VDGLGDGEGIGRAVGAPDADDGQFSLEGNHLLGERWAGDRVDGLRRVLRPLDGEVATAVVAAAAGLEHHRPAEVGAGGPEVAGVVDAPERGDGDAGVVERLLLAELVAGRPERLGVGVDRRARLLAHPLQRVRVREFDLVGEHVGPLAQFAERLVLVEVADDLVADDRRGGALRRGIRDDQFDAERAGGLAEHPPELAAADHAHRRSGGRELHRAWVPGRRV